MGEEPDARALGAERLEVSRVVGDLELQEARAGARLLERALGAVGERRRAGVLDRADEEVRRRLDHAAREVLAARDRGRRDDQLRAVEVEDAARLLLVARGDVVTGQAADVLDAVQGGADDVGLDREPVLVAADDLHDRLDVELLERDRDRDVGGVRVRRGVVGRIDRVDPRLVLLEPPAHGVHPPAVDPGELARDHDAVAGQLALELRHAYASSPGFQPAGVQRSRLLRKLAQDDVFLRRLSTGGRMWSYSSRQAFGRPGM